MDESTKSENSRAQFDKTPAGWQKRWKKEMDTSEDLLSKFVEQGEKVNDKYLGKTNRNSEGGLNLFHSSIDTVMAMMYGQVPKVDFDRRYADPNDDQARVATLMCERILNSDIERPDDDYTAVLRHCLQDRLLPGLGVARVRYDAEFDKIQHPAIMGKDDDDNDIELAPEYEESILKFEKAPIDYVHWKDFRYSYARTWHEVRWAAFRSYLDLDELTARFGEEKAKKVKLTAQYTSSKSSKEEKDAWLKGEVWEIWNKEDRRVYWWSDGMDEILDEADDPLKLNNFLPCPRPLIANTTTTLLLPRADYVISQDLYDSIDSLFNRIEVLTKAVRVVGVYDKKIPEIKRILKESAENDMIPVDNWAMFGERGGFEGVVGWFPLEEVVNTMDKLRELLAEKIQQLYQVTGLSDIMRGQSEGSDRVSATEQSIKAKFASVRMQYLQEELARFGTDLIRLKAEVLSKHFQPETLVKQSNMLMTSDAEYIPQAVQLIKNPEEFVWRVAVRPESLAMVDYQSLQQERSEYITALATFMQSAQPIAESMPGSMPVLLELLKWGLAGFKGSQQIEGVLDKAIKGVQNTPPQPKTDPEADAQRQHEQVSMQHEAQQAQIDAQNNQQQAQLEMQKMQAQFQIDMQEMDRKHQLAMEELTTKFNLQLKNMIAEAMARRHETDTSKELTTHETDESIREKENEAELRPKPGSSV